MAWAPEQWSVRTRGKLRDRETIARWLAAHPDVRPWGDHLRHMLGMTPDQFWNAVDCNLFRVDGPGSAGYSLTAKGKRWLMELDEEK